MNDAAGLHYGPTAGCAIAGVHLHSEALGAWRNGTRVRKSKMGHNDTHQIGALATVIGSFTDKGVTGYFVIWDDMPSIAVGITADRVAPA